jgi:hypothetical protein
MGMGFDAPWNDDFARGIKDSLNVTGQGARLGHGNDFFTCHRDIPQSHAPGRHHSAATDHEVQHLSISLSFYMT